MSNRVGENIEDAVTKLGRLTSYTYDLDERLGSTVTELQLYQRR